MSPEPHGAGAAAPRGWRRPFDIWIDRLDDGRSLALALAAFVLIWTIALMLAYSNAGLHPDVLEAWSLGRELSWGNPKHPPLMGWIARAWTTVFPLRDWSFQLLAMTNAAIALWIIDLIARRFVGKAKRALILCLVLLLPTYHFFAQRFNANTVLLALWPLATYCFLRSFESLRAGWAVAAGAACGFAFLGKYYSAFLLLSFVLAGVLHPNRRKYLLSPAPWLSTATGLIVLAPHLSWVAHNDFQTLNFALLQHGQNSLGETLGSCLHFLVGALGYLALPLLLWLLACASRWRRAIPRASLPNDGLKLLALICIGTLVFPVIAALQTRTELTPIWTLAGLFLPIIVIVAGSAVKIDRVRIVRLLAGLLAFHIAILGFAPLHARYRDTHTHDLSRNIMIEVANQIARLSEAETGRAMAVISGNEPLALAAAFYSPNHPIYRPNYDLDSVLAVPDDTALQPGWTGLCLPYNPVCMDWLAKVAARIPSNQKVETTLKIDSIRVLMIRPPPAK